MHHRTIYIRIQSYTYIYNMHIIHLNKWLAHPKPSTSFYFKGKHQMLHHPAYSIWTNLNDRSPALKSLKELDCWVTRVWPNGSKAGGQNSGQDGLPTQNQTIWVWMTRLSLIWNLLKQSGRPIARSPFSVSPSGPPNDLVHVITTGAVKLSVPQMTTNVGEFEILLSKLLGEKKVEHVSEQCFLFLLPQSQAGCQVFCFP